MPSSVGQRGVRSSRLHAFVHRNTLWLLIGCYGLAAVLPGPGLALRDWSWSLGPAPEAQLTLPLLLLALLLFCAALLTDVPQIRSIGLRPAALGWALLAVWLGPALLVALAGRVVPWVLGVEETSGLLVGLVLIASMPVANSSVGWTQNAGGNLAWSLALVLVSISLCPWLTPRLLAWLGLGLLPDERAYCDALVANFSGAFFVVWVILPTLAGLVCRHLVGPPRLAAASDVVRSTSVAALLLLNYVNAALALPDVLAWSEPLLLAITTLLAAAMSLVGLVSAWAIARSLRLPVEDEAALWFGISMKHTGLALLLAGAVLAEQHLAIWMIVLATLMQHLLAGVVQWHLQTRLDPPEPRPG